MLYKTTKDHDTYCTRKVKSKYKPDTWQTSFYTVNHINMPAEADHEFYLYVFSLTQLDFSNLNLKNTSFLEKWDPKINTLRTISF